MNYDLARTIKHSPTAERFTHLKTYVEQGGDINGQVQDTDSTVLQFFLNERVEVVQYLLEHGGDPNRHHPRLGTTLRLLLMMLSERYDLDGRRRQEPEIVAIFRLMRQRGLVIPEDDDIHVLQLALIGGIRILDEVLFANVNPFVRILPIVAKQSSLEIMFYHQQRWRYEAEMVAWMRANGKRGCASEALRRLLVLETGLPQRTASFLRPVHPGISSSRVEPR